MHKITVLTTCAVLATLATACSSIECPLNSRVMATWRFGDNGRQLTDTLTISSKTTYFGDTVLVNRVCDVDSVQLPMSYGNKQDVYYLDFLNEDKTHTIDTLTVTKSEKPQFESVDCGLIMFHYINEVQSTHHKIDQVKINNDYVTYNDERAHLIITLQEAAQ